MSAEQSKQYDIESAWSSSLWLLALLPEASVTLASGTEKPASDAKPFPAVEMGPIIGKGSFGYVCKGMLGSIIVAVKVGCRVAEHNY